MIKRFFWILLGAALAVFGVNYLKKKAAENPEQFSTDVLIEKFIEIFDAIKVKRAKPVARVRWRAITQ